jgi:hypothetical protein
MDTIIHWTTIIVGWAKNALSRGEDKTMNYVLWLILSAAGALAIWGVSRSSKASGPESPKSLLTEFGRVVVIGDSLAVGMKTRFEALAAADGVLLDYNCKGGTTTGEWVTRLPDLQAGDVLVCVLGTNDAAGSGKRFHDAMYTILDYASARGVPVVWAEPTGTHLKSYDRVLGELQQAKIEEDIYEIVPAPSEGYGNDNIHLTTAAYAAWADAIWSVLQGEK